MSGGRFLRKRSGAPGHGQIYQSEDTADDDGDEGPAMRVTRSVVIIPACWRTRMAIRSCSSARMPAV